MTLDYIDSEKELEATISLLFCGVSENGLSAYISGSVVDYLTILEGDQFWASIEPCYGMMGGSFKCTSVTAALANT